MEKEFKIVTTIILSILLVSAFFHFFLYMSDSEEYRRWVTIQIALQITGAGSLYFVRRFNFLALMIFVVLSVPFLYINAVYVNYGDNVLQAVFIVLFWLIYGSLIFKVRNNFTQGKLGTNGRST